MDVLNSANSKPDPMTVHEIQAEWAWIKRWHMILWRNKRCLPLGRDERGAWRKLIPVKDYVGRVRRFRYHRSDMETIVVVSEQVDEFTDKCGLWRSGHRALREYKFTKQSCHEWRKKGLLEATQRVMRCRGGYFRELWFFLDEDLQSIHKALHNKTERDGNWCWGDEVKRVSGQEEWVLKWYRQNEKPHPLLGKVPRSRLHAHAERHTHDNITRRRLVVGIEFWIPHLEKIKKKLNRVVRPELEESDTRTMAQVSEDTEVPLTTVYRIARDLEDEHRPRSRLSQVGGAAPRSILHLSNDAAKQIKDRYVSDHNAKHVKQNGTVLLPLRSAANKYAKLSPQTVPSQERNEQGRSKEVVPPCRPGRD